MAKWQCYGTVVGSKYLGEVEAETAEEAREKMEQKASVSLCHQCSREECQDPEITDITVEASS